MYNDLSPCSSSHSQTTFWRFVYPFGSLYFLTYTAKDLRCIQVLNNLSNAYAEWIISSLLNSMLQFLTIHFLLLQENMRRDLYIKMTSATIIGMDAHVCKQAIKLRETQGSHTGWFQGRRQHSFLRRDEAKEKLTKQNFLDHSNKKQETKFHCSVFNET